MVSDALTDILSSIRMKGSVFSRAEMTAPFGVESGVTMTGIFHAVVRGQPWIRLADGAGPVDLEPGDVVLFPFGDNHLITDAPGTPPQPIGLLTDVDDRGMGRLVVEGGGARTTLLCGKVSFDAADAHPVMDLLPPMIRVRDHDGRIAGVVETIIGLISTEVDDPQAGSEILVARLTDVLLVYALRAYIDALAPGEGGWLGALGDPHVRSALDRIHAGSAESVGADQLARAAGMSRSAFFAHFRDQVGMTPGEYQTRWRIHLAARLLRDEGFSVAAAGRQVGYATEAAFSNAFLRVMGVRPGAYRRAG